ncbi:TonB-dependent receptor [Gammaproteobacteria bacterium]|nr:TonB-dependent receptor [Gammaproteobacteria bacterium]
MFNKDKYVLAFLLSFAFIVPAVIAQDEDDSDVEDVVVTGSRIESSEFTGAQPVVVITQESIARTGDLGIAEVLRDLPINIAGSFYERSGSSAGSQAQVSLRGLGAGRTLVLIDGRRIPGSPKLDGASANINMLPTAAVERVEILADGASAVYGSDAIGGVVNVITKKGFDGMTISGSIGQPDLPGGEEEKFSIVGGVTGDDSSITWSYEHSQRDIIYLTDREYTAGRAPTDDNFSTGFSVSSYAWNYILNEDDPANGLVKGQWLPAAECGGDPRFLQDGKTYILGAAPTGGLDNNYLCSFDYTQIMAQDAGKKSDYFTVNYDKELGNGNSAYAQVVASRQETFGRYAPPAAFINPYPAGLANVRIPAQADGTPERVVTLNVPVQLRKRFIEIGPRASADTDWTGNVVVGFTGEVMNDYTWDISMQWHIADYLTNDCCYLQKPEYTEAAQAFKDSGTFRGQTSLFHPDVVAYYTSSPSVTSHSQFRSLEYTIGGPLKMVPDTDFVAGVQSAEYNYENIYDKQSEVGNVGGSSGNSSANSRDYTALFFESKTSLLDGAGELSVAVRSDDYSDFGKNTSWTVKGLYDVMDGLTLRASVGTGFRAPGLGDLAANTTFSADSHTDYVKCAAQGIARPDCPSEQVNTYISANPNLGPEESESTNFGAIYTMGNHSVAVDWFSTEIDGVITTITVQDIIDASILGASYSAQLTSQGAYCERLNGQADANLQQCFRNPINGNQASTSGVDLKYNGLYETAVGDFDVNFSTVIMDEYESEAFFNGPVVNYVGLTSVPEMRYSVDVGHTLRDLPELYLSIQYDYIDELANNTDANYNPEGTVDSYSQVNLRGVYTVPGVDGLELSVMIRNLTKEDPPLNTSGDFNRQIHSNLGMQTIVGFTWDL